MRPRARECAARPPKVPTRRCDVPYVDGFVIPIPKRGVAAYRTVARKAGKIWLKHGALEFRECAGDDLKGMKGTATFRRVFKLKPGETVMFSWIVFKSKADRKRVNAKVMKDPRMASLMTPEAMPLDMKRMLYGGFKVIVDL
jgi:uncharacterized protein YbaA (DUF1428 family)